LRRIQKDPDLELRLIVGGMHLSPEFGLSARAIVQDGFEISDRIEMLLSSDTPEGIAKSIGLGTIGFAQSFSRCRPDILLVLGDRFEVLAAVAAALPFNIPVGHIHGGESTEGSIDEAIRHSVTKMSHLHFVATEFYGQRVIQMGEEPWRISVSGAPSLDNLHDVTLLPKNKLGAGYDLNLERPFLLVTFHPVTLEHQETKSHLQELLDALDELDASVIFTYPNADTGSRSIIEMIQEFVRQNEYCQMAVNLGTQGYFSLMSHADAMVGNSSSGIIEAASLKVPVVNIGERQRGRLHGKNVIDVPCAQKEIREGVFKALTPEFRTSLSDLENLYGDGHAAQRIVEVLKETPMDQQLLMKRFYCVGTDEFADPIRRRSRV
jgi:UDP-hydrolysing UDP-N-acetyl-D-glucosamine 2-epimerase